MEQRQERRVPLSLLLSIFVASRIVGFASDIAGPTLINHHPLLQIALNPRNRWLLLASPQISAVPYYIVGFLRLVSTDPVGYVLGYQYGDAAVAWAERQMGDTEGVIKMIQRGFGKVAPLVILIAPSFYWCVLAGAARMRLRLFITLNIVGTIGRLILFRLAGDAFRDELEDVLDWIQRYQWWLVGLSVIVVALQIFRGRERGTLESPTEMAAEIEAEEETLRDE
jgi:membrane protein DedA with SNARE-associated domain